MPIAELLEGHFDMQLLGKLTLSVAAMLFVSLVFRFYNTRAQNRRRAQRSVHATQGSYDISNNEREPQSTAANEECNEEKHFQQSSEMPLQKRCENSSDAPERLQSETANLGSCAKEIRSSEEPSQERCENANGSIERFQSETTNLDSCAKEIRSLEEPSKKELENTNGAVEREQADTTNFGNCAKEIRSSEEPSKKELENTNSAVEREQADTTNFGNCAKEIRSSEEPSQEGLENTNGAVERGQTETLDSCAKEKMSSEKPLQERLKKANDEVEREQVETVVLESCAKEKMSSEKPLQENLENTNGELLRDQRETMDMDNCAKEDTAGSSNITKDVCTKVGQANHRANNGKLKLTLQPPDGTEKGPGSPNGRRSPCLLKKLDGGLGVGRELRQDLGNQGMFSSFQSKAEIKVENADLILDMAGNSTVGVHGKIYDYYVESSSHFISDLSPCGSRPVSPVFGQFEKSSLFKSQSLDLPKERSRTPSPQPSSFIMRDLEITPRFTNEPPSAFKPEYVRPSRQVVIRQDSYLTAADSELPMPCPTQKTTEHRSCSPAQLNDSPLKPLDADKTNTDASEKPQVETVARAKFLHLPENLGNAELESLMGKLDLGNCLEALALAKKYGHNALQQAALSVMSDNYLQVLRDQALFGRLRGGERDIIQTQRMKGRKWLVVADMDATDWRRQSSQSTVLKSDSVKTSCGMYYYDDYKDTWQHYCHIPQEVLSKGCAMCTMDNYLFIAVGFQGPDRPSKKVYCYNPITSIWSEICPMNEARPHCKLVALQGHLYAIGGECLSTVERYDPRTNKWTFVAPLPNETFAVAHRATACNGELFVAGGTLRYTLLRYNPKTNIWRESMIVGSKDRTTEMVGVRNFLYRFDVSALGISVYRYHAVARIWYECSSIRLPYCTAFQCVVMDNIIYCVGRQFTLRFLADEVSPSFVAQDLKVLSQAKGILFPFVLVLPDNTTLQTCV